ncbi:hypothetical protein ACFQPC_16285 [Herminiimonas glaciei]|uniref:Uncharacterized protein n=1 Tax=Herminiimonas glaciei TaxID=523788 RepID=A0ABW2IFD7_9BURK
MAVGAPLKNVMANATLAMSAEPVVLLVTFFYLYIGNQSHIKSPETTGNATIFEPTNF